MNQRIRELAERTIANVRFWKGCNQESYSVDEHELTKFAEAIICASADVINKELYCDESPIANKMKEHFGVEE